MRTVVISDMGLGNLRSVVRALERTGVNVRVEPAPAAIADADALVVPGQGAFRDAARALEAGFGDAIRAHIDAGRPYLGICLGLQLLFESSEESVGARGLGVFRGAVKKLHAPGLRIPHIGWNDVTSVTGHLAFEALAGNQVYFAHSFAAVPTDAEITCATTIYGDTIASGVAKDNVMACQFHPEKSQHAGARFLAAWRKEIG